MSDIFEIEEEGPALIVADWGHLIPKNPLCLQIIDNDSVLDSLVKGSSSVVSSECISAYTLLMIDERGLYPWLDSMASGANTVDFLSRGKLSDPWVFKHMFVFRASSRFISDFLFSSNS